MKNKKKYFLIYTIIFIAMVLACFYVYYSRGLSLIFDGDGYSQHYKALIYYSDYLKGIFHNIFVNHDFNIQRFDFAIGEGRDILENFNYYVIGDPIAFLSVLVPRAYLYIFYDLSIILRLYLSGIAFSFLASYKKERSIISLLAGSITYVFCFWMIYNSVRHIYFLNPTIYLPLVILGVEKIINQENPYLLTIAVMISGLSNFYFFFDIVLLTITYVAVRLLILYRKDVGKMFKTVLSIFKYSLFGVFLASVILLPIIGTFLGDSRTGLDYGRHLLYPLTYYLKLPSMFISTSRVYWLCMGYASPVILAIVALLLDFKKKPLLVVLLLLGGLFIIFPFFGQVFNGLSYMSNKWCFGFSLLIAYILTEMWDDLGKHRLVETGVFLFIAAACVLLGSGINVIIPLVIGLLFASLLFTKKLNRTFQQIIMVCLILLNVIFLANWQYSSIGTNYSSTATAISDVAGIFEDSEAYMIREIIKDDEFCRYSGSNITQNASILFGTNTVDFYWSLNNANEANFRRDMAIDEYSLFNYREFDKRSTLYKLANVKYYLTSKGYDGLIPSGYEYEKSIDDYDVYVANDPLPFGYTTDKKLSYDDWSKLNPVAKEEALSGYVVLENVDSDGYNSTVVELPYEISGSDIEIVDEGVLAKKDNAVMKLSYKCDETMANYLCFSGFDFDDTKNYFAGKDTSTTLLIDGIDRHDEFTYSNNDNRYYNARHDFVMYLGNNKSGEIEVQINFESKGLYCFDKMQILVLEQSKLDENLERMGNEHLDNVVFGIDEVSGTINSSKDQYLIFSIPYSKGWKAYVDNKEVEVYQADVYHLALAISKGNHEVKLVYENKLIDYGLYLSLLGGILLVADIIIKKRRRG